ncbi:MAG: tripartite tricarboxylate transporter substrate-binding protein [Rhizobiaceae bacterium]
MAEKRNSPERSNHRRLPRRRVLAALAMATAMPLVWPAGPARAQQVDMLTIVVPFPPGGSTDAIARLLGEELRGKYAKTVIVENKPGGGGRIGTVSVKDSAPDGKTALIVPAVGFEIYPHVYKSLSYSIKDFATVAQLGVAPMVYSVGPKVPADVKTFPDYLKWVKGHQDNAFYATPGAGSLAHFLGVMVSRGADVKLDPVHYSGDAPQAGALLSGEVAASASVIGGIIAHARKGTARILAATGAERSSLAPDVPTFKELGFDIDGNLALDLFMPAGTPGENVDKLSEAVKGALDAPKIQEAMKTFGFEPAYLPPAELASDLDARLKRWGPIVEASGFKADE